MEPGGGGSGNTHPSSCYWLFHLRSFAYGTSGTHGTHSTAGVRADFTSGTHGTHSAAGVRADFTPPKLAATAVATVGPDAVAASARRLSGGGVEDGEFINDGILDDMDRSIIRRLGGVVPSNAPQVTGARIGRPRNG